VIGHRHVDRQPVASSGFPSGDGNAPAPAVITMSTPKNRSRWSQALPYRNTQGNWIVDATPILDVLDFYTAFGDREQIARQIGVDSAAIRRLQRERVCTIDKLDRIACGLGRPELISIHYGEVS
jgi:hypothetical protein